MSALVTNSMYALSPQPVPPMVAQVLRQLAAEQDGTEDTWQNIRHLRTMHEAFNRLHPFGLAKKYGLLIDGSGEELACQFMTYYNLYSPGTY